MPKVISTIIIAIIFLSAFIFNSCTLHIEKRGEGKEIEKTFTVSEFKGIQANRSVKIIYTIGDSISIKAKGQDTEVDNLEIFVGADSLLHINKKEEKKDENIITLNLHEENCTLYITGPALSKIGIAGDADFTCSNTMNTDNLSIVVNGSGDIDLDSVNVKSFTTTINGAGDMDIKNLKTNEASITVTGSGDINTKLDHVDKTFVQISGAGDIDFDFNDCNSAELIISGAGDAKLSGKLHHFSKTVNGAGDIDDKNLTIKE